MMRNYEPMRAFLEARLQQAATLATAPDYKTFNVRMRQNDYAFVLTVANSAYWHLTTTTIEQFLPRYSASPGIGSN